MNKNIVPIVFCFDERMELAAGVCITSLLENAQNTTFYDIYILHGENSSFKDSKINELVTIYGNCSITYRCVGNAFDTAFEVRGITIATYYRLLIPEVIPEYDKIIYMDVDIIFRDDLFGIYHSTDMDGYYVAGVSTPVSDITTYVENTIGMKIHDYICAGTLILNSKMIREANLISEFKRVARKQWLYQDQDTLNIVCKGKIKILPPSFGMVNTMHELLLDKNQTWYSTTEQEYALRCGVLHYNGPKPWKELCLNFDIWWEYYRKSIFFDQYFYYQFYYKQVTNYDRLSLYKRVKIVLRYFKNGRLKD